MLYIACVVYNRRIDEVMSIVQFETFADMYNDVKIVILDNTTDENIREKNVKYTQAHQIVYLCNQGNIGLSKAYNRMLEIAGSKDWILWSDDDTMFSLKFLENIYKALVSGGYAIISGIVKTNGGGILSPIYRNNKSKTEIKIGEKYNSIYCINSGLCVKRSIYDLIGNYDEVFFLDMIDYWLFDELHKNKLDTVLVVGGAIRQNFSGVSRSSVKSKLKRFRIYLQDFNHYCDVENKSWIYRKKILIKRICNIIKGSILC